MDTGKEGYTYAAIPDKLNRSKEDVPAKAIFVETENKFATELMVTKKYWKKIWLINTVKLL